MAVATALFYDAARRRQGLPGLAPHLRDLALKNLPEEYHRFLEQPFFDPILVGAPFRVARARGLIGVPILDEDEKQALMDGYDKVDHDDDVEPDSWWELWSLENGEYALVPGDNNPELSVTVCALVRAGLVVQLRRFASGFLLANGVLTFGGPPNIPNEECIREDIDEPGCPYHGRCADKGCGGGCSADVVIVPREGLYVLKGCSCR